MLCQCDYGGSYLQNCHFKRHDDQSVSDSNNNNFEASNFLQTNLNEWDMFLSTMPADVDSSLTDLTTKNALNSEYNLYKNLLDFTV